MILRKLIRVQIIQAVLRVETPVSKCEWQGDGTVFGWTVEL